MANPIDNFWGAVSYGNWGGPQDEGVTKYEYAALAVSFGLLDTFPETSVTTASTIMGNRGLFQFGLGLRT